MRVAVLGTGMVGKEIGSALIGLGHEVRLGSRTANNEAATAWAAETGGSHGTFADATAWAEIVFLAAKGEHAIGVLEAAGAENLRGKVVVDITNPLDFSKGFPPRLTVANDDSLAEQLQRAFPDARFVKSLNTLTAPLMLHPERLAEPTAVFVAGDDAGARATVTGILREAGWQQIVDLGPLSASRGLEAWLLLWTRLYGAFGTGTFNVRFVK